MASASTSPGASAPSGEAFASRVLQIESAEGGGRDEVDVLYEMGFSDGLPVVAPTPQRVARMLTGTRRRGDEILGKSQGQMRPRRNPQPVIRVNPSRVSRDCEGVG